MKKILLLFLVAQFNLLCVAAPSFHGVPMDQSYESFRQAFRSKCYKSLGDYYDWATIWQNEDCDVYIDRSRINPQWMGQIHFYFTPKADVKVRYKEFTNALTQKYGTPTEYRERDSTGCVSTTWVGTDVQIELRRGWSEARQNFIAVSYTLKSKKATTPQGVDISNL